MTENLINEIKDAEARASRMIESAEATGRERLDQIRNEHDKKRKELLDSFQKEKKEVLEKARLDAGREGKVRRKSQKEQIAALKTVAQKKRDRILDYLIEKIQGP